MPRTCVSSYARALKIFKTKVSDLMSEFEFELRRMVKW